MTATGIGTATARPDAALPVSGVLPHWLDGTFLHAFAHPTRPDGDPVLAGVRLTGGTARPHRGAPAAGSTCGSGAPGRVRPLCATGEYLVLVDLPVGYDRAAALVGERSPHRWRPGAVTRFGLVHQRTGRIRWFPIGAWYVPDLVSAAVTGAGTVVLTGLRHPPRRGSGAALCVWTLHPGSGRVRVRVVDDAVHAAVADGRVPRRVFAIRQAAAGASLVCHDLAGPAGVVPSRFLGFGSRADRPVVVSRHESTVDGAVLVAVRAPALDRGELHVFGTDRSGLRSRAVVELPVPLPPAADNGWLPAGQARPAGAELAVDAVVQFG